MKDPYKYIWTEFLGTREKIDDCFQKLSNILIAVQLLEDDLEELRRQFEKTFSLVVHVLEKEK